jgi:hypothetical protein
MRRTHKGAGVMPQSGSIPRGMEFAVLRLLRSAIRLLRPQPLELFKFGAHSAIHPVLRVGVYPARGNKIAVFASNQTQETARRHDRQCQRVLYGVASQFRKRAHIAPLHPEPRSPDLRIHSEMSAEY